MNQIKVWHLPLLADPGPAKLAIQLALLSSRICLSILPATLSKHMNYIFVTVWHLVHVVD